MNDYFQLPRSKQTYLSRRFGEAHGDIAIATNILTELSHCCERTTHCTPTLDFTVDFLTLDTKQAVRIIVTEVPSLSHTSACSIAKVAPSAIYRIRFVFRDELTQHQLYTGRVEIEFWASASPSRERFPYVAPKRGKSRNRDVEIDYEGLNTTADDRDNIEQLMEYVHHMAPLMPRIGVSCEPLVRSGSVTQPVSIVRGGPPKKRPKRAEAADEETALSEQPTTAAPLVLDNSNHVGFCLFFVGVPSFDASFFDFLKKMLGNVMLEAVVLAPVRWTDPSTSQNVDTPQELAISLRRTACTEADAGPYCIDGSARLVRVLARNAKAFKGVPIETPAQQQEVE